MLRTELSTMVQREARFKEEIRAYQEHAYEMQQAAVQQAEAEQAAITAELQRELPPSARPGEVTPRLGGDADLCDLSELDPPPPRPQIVPVLNMGLVHAKKEADAKAEAEEDRAAPMAEGGEEDDEEEEEDDDDDDDDDDDEAEEVEMARLHALQLAVANGTVDLSQGIPPHLMPGGMAGARLEAALGWVAAGRGAEDGEASSDAKPRVLAAVEPPDDPPPPKAPPQAPERALPAYASGASGGELRPGSAPSVPALNLKPFREPGTQPEGYHDEFLREMAAAKASGAIPADGLDERSAAVDRMLYSHDPDFGKAFAAAPNADGSGTRAAVGKENLAAGAGQGAK